MIRTFALYTIVLHVLYALSWFAFGEHNKLVIERVAVTVAASVLALTYLAFAGAYIWARKSRLNTALAVHKFYLFILFAVLTLPSLWGVLLRDAPYRVVGNPYSFWIAPAWLRMYVYVAVAVTSAGTVYEFWRRNWGPGSVTEPDPPMADPPSWLQSTDVVVSHESY